MPRSGSRICGGGSPRSRTGGFRGHRETGFVGFTSSRPCRREDFPDGRTDSPAWREDFPPGGTDSPWRRTRSPEGKPIHPRGRRTHPGGGPINLRAEGFSPGVEGFPEGKIDFQEGRTASILRPPHPGRSEDVRHSGWSLRIRGRESNRPPGTRTRQQGAKLLLVVLLLEHDHRTSGVHRMDGANPYLLTRGSAHTRVVTATRKKAGLQTTPAGNAAICRKALCRGYLRQFKHLKCVTIEP
jgi:hypothetical protein